MRLFIIPTEVCNKLFCHRVNSISLSSEMDGVFDDNDDSNSV